MTELDNLLEKLDRSRQLCEQVELDLQKTFAEGGDVEGKLERLENLIIEYDRLILAAGRQLEHEEKELQKWRASRPAGVLPTSPLPT